MTHDRIRSFQHWLRSIQDADDVLEDDADPTRAALKAQRDNAKRSALRAKEARLRVKQAEVQQDLSKVATDIAKVH